MGNVSAFKPVTTYAGVNIDEVFTTDPKASPVHVASWGFLGDTWPYFRPNFVNMEAYREEHGVDEACPPMRSYACHLASYIAHNTQD